MEMAETIANKSPVAVQGTKRSLIYSRDHTVDEGLENIVTILPVFILLNECLLFISKLLQTYMFFLKFFVVLMDLFRRWQMMK